MRASIRSSCSCFFIISPVTCGVWWSLKAKWLRLIANLFWYDLCCSYFPMLLVVWLVHSPGAMFMSGWISQFVWNPVCAFWGFNLYPDLITAFPSLIPRERSRDYFDIHNPRLLNFTIIVYYICHIVRHLYIIFLFQFLVFLPSHVQHLNFFQCVPVFFLCFTLIYCCVYCM